MAIDVIESATQDVVAGRETYNAMHTDRPALTVRCASTTDVVDAVALARERGFTPAVRGGGHSIAGLSATDGGMLIDLSPMSAVHVDPEARVAHVQGGALLSDVDRETQAFALATPLGAVSETGVAGLTLGGGYGWLRRKHGLSCDNVVSAQVVCADGVVRTASAEANPDLYWAIRGGGGNFGIVTSFTFRLHPLGPEVAFAATFYPVEEIGDVLRKWRAYVAEAPREVTSIVVALTFPADPEMPPETHDRPVAIVGGVYAGDVEEGMRVLQPLRELGTPLFDMSGPTPFTHVQSGFDPLFPRQQLRSYWKSQYLEALSDDAVDVIVAAATSRPAPTSVVATFQMGGAIDDVDPEASAFSVRGAPYMVSFDANWSDPADDDTAIGWARSQWDAIGSFGTGEVYLNFMGNAGEAPDASVDSAFGRNLQRLREIKAKYDPGNLFRLNNNIEPAA
jgi:FAD/FMN-containing dehydrogenase